MMCDDVHDILVARASELVAKKERKGATLTGRVGTLSLYPDARALHDPTGTASIRRSN